MPRCRNGLLLAALGLFLILRHLLRSPGHNQLPANIITPAKIREDLESWQQALDAATASQRGVLEVLDRARSDLEKVSADRARLAKDNNALRGQIEACRQPSVADATDG